MADHITVVVSGGATRILQTTDNTSYHTPAHQLVNAAGTTTLGVFAEDAAHSSGHTGLMMLTVRQDTAAALAGTDADYQPPITDASGRLWVNAGAVGTITPGTAATSLGKAEDGAHTSGDVGVMGLAVRTDTPANRSGTDGDYEPLQMAAGRLWTSTTIDAALPAGTNGIGKLTSNAGVTIGAVEIAAAQTLATVTTVTTLTGTTTLTPGTGATNLGKAEDAAHTSGDVGVMGLGVRNDADAALVGTDLDYITHSHDSAGRAKVNVIEERVILDVTPTCDTSAYTAGDVLFDTVTCGTVGRVNGGTVVLESVTVLDEDDQATAVMDLYFLDSNVSLGTFNVAPAITDANARKLLGYVSIAAADWKDLGGSKIATIRGLNLAMKCDAASQIIYVAGVTAGTPTQTASGIKLKLAFRRG